ncbi:hypothetical protein IC615_27380 [Serratia ureilytica]
MWVSIGVNPAQGYAAAPEENAEGYGQRQQMMERWEWWATASSGAAAAFAARRCDPQDIACVRNGMQQLDRRFSECRLDAGQR